MQVNKLLAPAGPIIQKTLKTHSFQINVITPVAAVAGIEALRQLSRHEKTALASRSNQHILFAPQENRIRDESFAFSENDQADESFRADYETSEDIVDGSND